MPAVLSRILPRLIVLGCLALLGTLPVFASAAWPHEQGDVPPDPAIRWGRLENGLRYAVRKNSEPAGRVYLILQVAVGSVHERDDQRGYAHFVEHMMFRGTRKYPATSIVNFLQREGLEMGADTSAFTNFTTTFYNLDLPHNSREKITLGLSILRDFTDSAVIAKAEVKREAKVIDSERRTRDSSASRVGEELTAFLHPDTLITRRSPHRHARIGRVRHGRAAHGILPHLVPAVADDRDRRRRRRPRPARGTHPHAVRVAPDRHAGRTGRA
ncbi:MAG TPA: insulinase family protein [Lacunisphaera sp.]|nr:insulinase family protein [Lacunisphaera sp.]